VSPPATQTRPGLLVGAFFFVLTVLLVPPIIGHRDLPRWALIYAGGPILALIFCWKDNAPVKWPDLLGFGFLAFTMASLSWAPDPTLGVLALWHWAALAGLYLVGSRLVSLEPVLLGAGIGIALNSSLVLAQVIGFDGIPQKSGPAGLFVVGNYLAEAAVLVMVALVLYRQYFAAMLCLPAAVLPMGRGALLALAAVGLAWVWPRSRTLAVSLLAGLVLLAIVLSNHSPHQSSTLQRLDIWRDSVAGLTWTGSGAGSYYTLFPGHMKRHDFFESRPSHAHNDALELIYEYGPGALLLGALLSFALAGSLTPARALLLAFVVEGIPGFPLHWPVTAALAALALGHLCRDGAVVRGLQYYRRNYGRIRRAREFRDQGRTLRPDAGGGAAVPVRL